MTAERIPSPVRGVKRDKSLALDDVFASRYFGGKNFDKARDGARSVSGDMYKSKDKLVDQEGDESGADTDTGHSVATTGHRSRRRQTRKKSFSRRTADGHKKAMGAFPHASGSQLISALYKNDDTESDHEDDEIAPENDASADAASTKESKHRGHSHAQRASSERPRKSRDPSPSRERREHRDRAAKPGGAESADKTGRSRTRRVVKPSSSTTSAARSDKTATHSSSRSREHSHVATERSSKSEQESHGEHHRPHRRKRDETHHRPPTHTTSQKSERANLPGKSAHSKSRDESGKAATRSRTASEKGDREAASSSPRSRRHKHDNSHSAAAPRSPPAIRSATPKSVRKPRNAKAHSPNGDSPTSITEHTDSKPRSPAKVLAKDEEFFETNNGPAKDQLHDVPNPAGSEVSESEDADDTGNDDDHGDSATVIQFDPSQDDSVYRVRQVTNTNSNFTIANSDGTSVEGHIAEIVDPMSEAQQFQAPGAGHTKELPIFDFLESDDFEFNNTDSYTAAAPLNLPSGGEEEEDVCDEDDDEGFDPHCDDPPNETPEERPYGYEDYYNEQLPRDYVADVPLDQDNPYEYGVDLVPRTGVIDEPDEATDDNPYGYDVYDADWNPEASAAYDESFNDSTFGTSFQNAETFRNDAFDSAWPEAATGGDDVGLFEDTQFGFDNATTFDEPAAPSSAASGLRCPSGGEEEDLRVPLEPRQDPEGREVKKKRIVKVKVVKKRSGSPHDPSNSNPDSRKGETQLDENGKPRRRKVVKKKIKPMIPNKPSRKADRDHDDCSQHSDDFSLDNVETTAQKKKHHIPKSLSSATSTQPSNALVAKLYDSFSRYNVGDDKEGDEDANGVNASGSVSSVPAPPKPGSNLSAALGALPPKSPLQSHNTPKGISPANSASSKKRRSVGLATSIGRYFSRSTRNMAAGEGGGGVGGGGDEGSISSNSRNSLGLFRVKGKQHQLLGDDSSYDSGHIQY